MKLHLADLAVLSMAQIDVIASEAKQFSPAVRLWIASSLRSSQ